MSALDITRNPFERAPDERLNFPGFSPSMFVKQETPASQKKRRTFRWSIEQISRLNPADIEEFPNQEYSSTFERDEEEEEAQKAIDEYFSQGSIVPSPWTPDRSIKHVTFSPLPPHTVYISAASSAESSYASPNSSSLQGKVDAGCQTNLSLPPEFNLEKLIGTTHYNCEDSGENKFLSVSSLRRNLFPFGENSPQKSTVKYLPLPSSTQVKPILKSPHSPSNPITSSPMSSRKVSNQASRSSSVGALSSPNISPITKPSRHQQTTSMSQTSRRLSVKSPLSSMDTSCHNVMESSEIEGIGAPFPDFSPIKDDEMSSGAARQSGEQAMELGDNKDEKLPEVLTMRDLADADDAHAEDDLTPPEINIEDLSSPFEKDISKLADLSEKMDAITASDDGNGSMNSSDCRPSSTENKNSDKIDRVMQPQPDLTETSDIGTSNEPGKETGFSSYSREAYKPSYIEEIDGDLVMKRARAALRRADRISPPENSRRVLLYSSQHNSASPWRSSNMDTNLSSMPWQPVRMSTPLVTEVPAPAVYDNSKFVERSGWYGNEIDAWRGTVGRGQTGKRFSPVMEDILRRKQILKAAMEEANSPIPWSYGHHVKSAAPRTYPLSYLERKALYGHGTRIETRSTGVDWHDAGTNCHITRTSWPSARPVTVHMGQGTRPLSPPVKVSTAKYPRAHPSGSAFKVALPYSYHDNSDSGYDSWRRGVSQWQRGLSSHH